MTSIECIDHPLTHKIPFGKKARFAAMGDCIVASKIGMAISSDVINSHFDGGTFTFSSNGIMEIFQSGFPQGWLVHGDYTPKKTGMHHVRAIPLCIPTLEGANAYMDFEVMPRETKILPDLTMRGVLDYLDLKLGQRVGEPIPIKGKIVLSEILVELLASIQPNMNALPMAAIVFKDGKDIGETVFFTTQADGSFETQYIPTQAGDYNLRIQFDGNSELAPDQKDLSGRVRKRPCSIVAEKMYVGKLVPYDDKTYKGNETITVSGRLITGDYENSGTLTQITAGIKGKTIIIKANGIDMLKTPSLDDGSFTYTILAQTLASKLSIDLQKMLENKLVKFTAEFEGDGIYTPADADTRIYLRGIYITLKVGVSIVQKLTDRIKFGNDLKIEGLLTKMTIGASDQKVAISVVDGKGATVTDYPKPTVVSTTATTDSIGAFRTPLKVEGAPVGQDGSYTIRASYTDPDFNVTVIATDEIEIEKWLTNMKVDDAFLKTVSIEKLAFGTPNTISGVVNYTEKSSGPIGSKVKLYELTNTDTRISIKSIINRIVQAGQAYTTQLKDEIRGVLAYLAKLKPVAEVDSIIAGAFSLSYRPMAMGTITLVAANFEDTVNYGSFQSFDVTVDVAQIAISLEASTRNVKLGTGKCTLSGLVTLKPEETQGIHLMLVINYYMGAKASVQTPLSGKVGSGMDGKYSYEWTPSAPGFYVFSTYHAKDVKVGEATSPATSVAVYTVDAQGKWICPLDGKSFETEADLIKHLNEHHRIYDKITRGCPTWRPYAVGNVVKYEWCKVKDRLGMT